MSAVLREHAEQQFAEELQELAKSDTRTRPPNWKLSPWAVATYLLGGELDNGFRVTPKYIGSRRVDRDRRRHARDRPRAAAARRARAPPRSWVSEHLAAAISGDSTLSCRAPPARARRQIRYGWNYARLLAEGPSMAALVPSPRHARDGGGHDRPRRRADAHPRGRAGLAHHDSVGEDAARPRTRQRGTGAQGLQRHRHRQRPRQRRQRAFERAQAPLQHGRAARCPRPSRRKSKSCGTASSQSAARSNSPPSRPRSKRSAAS